MEPADTILKAIQAGDAETVRTLVYANPATAGARDEQGISMVMQAAYHHRGEIVDVLLAANPPLDVLETAALGKREWIAELIDDNPASVATHSPDGFTPLHYACFFGHLPCAQLLIRKAADVNSIAENTTKVTPLHSAAAGRHLSIVELLIERGADVNARQHGGFTALHAAAMHGDKAMTRVLLDAGVDAQIQTDSGHTAADMASEKGHETVAALLRERL